MATFTVTTRNDVIDPNDDRLSLREAVAQANATAAADTIVFAGSLEGQTLVLARGELVLRQDVRIDGDRDNDGTEVTLSGDDASRVLRITGGGTDVDLRDLTLAEGRAPEGGNGGAVFLGGGSLGLADCTVRDSRCGGSYSQVGAGIFAADGSRVDIAASSIVDNRYAGEGGGIATGANVSLAIRDSLLAGNNAYSFENLGPGGAVALGPGGSLVMEGSIVRDNLGGFGGGVSLVDTTATIARSAVFDNAAESGGGIFVSNSRVTLVDSTIASNAAFFSEFSGTGGVGGGITTSFRGGEVVVRHSTITGNTADVVGGGIASDIFGSSPQFDLANSIVAGNDAGSAPDIAGAVTLSNGHNVFGSDVTGNVAGDHEGVAPGLIFAALDPDTGGGLLSPNGTVALRDHVANPALSAADPLASTRVDQLGTTRPQPPVSLPDLGAAERDQAALSTTPSANNDVLVGTAGGDTIAALAGNDLVGGLSGADMLGGGAGGDLLDGGPGDDRIDGGTGFDLASYLLAMPGWSST
jgi:hypothetical protein